VDLLLIIRRGPPQGGTNHVPLDYFLGEALPRLARTILSARFFAQRLVDPRRDSKPSRSAKTSLYTSTPSPNWGRTVPLVGGGGGDPRLRRGGGDYLFDDFQGPGAKAWSTGAPEKHQSRQ